MFYKQRWGIGAVCLLALVVLSCGAVKDSQEKGTVMKTALAFYKAIEDPKPEMEKIMELKDYRVYGYPALVYGALNITWGVEKLAGGGDVYQVEMPFWCHGNTASGEEKKLRRTLLVRLVADSASAGGWAVSRFRFQGDEELTFWRQFFAWLLWMFIAPLMFFLVLVVFAGGFWWPRVALLVAYLMGVPLRIYVSYLWFGTPWSAAIAMVAWTIFEGWIASRRRS